MEDVNLQHSSRLSLPSLPQHVKTLNSLHSSSKQFFWSSAVLQDLFAKSSVLSPSSGIEIVMLFNIICWDDTACVHSDCTQLLKHKNSFCIKQLKISLFRLCFICFPFFWSATSSLSTSVNTFCYLFLSLSFNFFVLSLPVLRIAEVLYLTLHPPSLFPLRHL